MVKFKSILLSNNKIFSLYLSNNIWIINWFVDPSKKFFNKLSVVWTKYSVFSSNLLSIKKNSKLIVANIPSIKYSEDWILTISTSSL